MKIILHEHNITYLFSDLDVDQVVHHASNQPCRRDTIGIMDNEWFSLFDPKNGLRPGWTNVFAGKINSIFPNCVVLFKRHRTMSPHSSRFQGKIMSADAYCKHKGCTKNCNYINLYADNLF